MKVMNWYWKKHFHSLIDEDLRTAFEDGGENTFMMKCMDIILLKVLNNGLISGFHKKHFK
jgi:hypothetical protein